MDFPHIPLFLHRHLVPISKPGDQLTPHLLLQPVFLWAVLGGFTWHWSWWQQTLQTWLHTTRVMGDLGAGVHLRLEEERISSNQCTEGWLLEPPLCLVSQKDLVWPRSVLEKEDQVRARLSKVGAFACPWYSLYPVLPTAISERTPSTPLHLLNRNQTLARQQSGIAFFFFFSFFLGSAT